MLPLFLYDYVMIVLFGTVVEGEMCRAWAPGSVMLSTQMRAEDKGATTDQDYERAESHAHQ